MRHQKKLFSLAFVALAAIVFGLTLVASQAAQAQTYKVIHTFTGELDGAYPFAGLTIDKAENLYGTAPFGGADDSGTVYRLEYGGRDRGSDPDPVWAHLKRIFTENAHH
jgi:uncharacterized repeat protein (TIGR03803 family)